jgi:cytidyltransferase-like protein
MQINICMSTIVLTTGGFDPLHSGHITYFEAAKKLGDILIVGVNSDAWLARKKGRSFMNQIERTAIIDALSVVDQTIWFNDDDGSACAAIEKVKSLYPNDNIVFANGGDRTRTNIPEMSVEGVAFKFGVGGENKMNSSSWILEEWKAPKTERSWGYYRVLHEVPGMKVKELTVNPGQSLSMQRHHQRAEYWIVSEGSAVVNSQLNSGYAIPPKTLTRHNEYRVPVAEWHQLTNPFEEPVKIVEIQYGEQCHEEDIERQ